MRKLIAPLLLLVGCGPVPQEKEQEVRSGSSDSTAVPHQLLTGDKLSATITIPRITGHSAAASEAIRRELAAVEQHAIFDANLCVHIAGDGQAHFEFEPQSINTRRGFATVRFTVERRCGPDYRRWAVVKTFNLATGEEVNPLSLISMTRGQWEALVARHSTSRFRVCTDHGESDVVAPPTPYIAADGIGVSLPLASDAPQTCRGDVLVIPDEAVRRASEDRLAHGWSGPAHQDYLFK